MFPGGFTAGSSRAKSDFLFSIERAAVGFDLVPVLEVTWLEALGMLAGCFQSNPSFDSGVLTCDHVSWVRSIALLLAVCSVVEARLVGTLVGKWIVRVLPVVVPAMGLDHS